ncbi:translation initiation factor IF- 2Mt [Schizosaccharomyces japonicus yFS275]|uniref:Translation initiation factor IF-2Mt n=1 Tax=Schizosaccharomyces japonicus (strain yFS275 / FY16936) TaxID=402676 RepID=B6K1D1_SCHJY|nr:translation initiation factor IF- 2Mt [Schizosaccharomyces japonicus yFS275]EEB07752.2 translation initiation factor IF- 2Mt [Schizosaccharomyces japonicus yFS275]
MNGKLVTDILFHVHRTVNIGARWRLGLELQNLAPKRFLSAHGQYRKENKCDRPFSCPENKCKRQTHGILMAETSFVPVRSFASSHKRVVPVLELPPVVRVSQLASMMRINTSRLVRLLRKVVDKNVTSEYLLPFEDSSMVAVELGFDARQASFASSKLLKLAEKGESRLNSDSLPLRPPIVTIMGHVDHGKTTLLDALRKSSIVATEHGGITQRIGAFSVPFSKGAQQITFIDTPGHAAFEEMRKRGASVTDIVVLVIAGDDGVQPQTVEALKHIQAAGVPMVVALTKCDRPGFSADKVQKQLLEHGVQTEEFGGDTQVCCVSGVTGQGLEELESCILALAEVLDIRASKKAAVEGWIIESSVSKGQGIQASVLIKQGTVRLGSFLVCKESYAKVRLLLKNGNVRCKQAFPGEAVQVSSFKSIPPAGVRVFSVSKESEAKAFIEAAQREKHLLSQTDLAHKQNEQQISAAKLRAKKSRLDRRGMLLSYWDKELVRDEQKQSSSTDVSNSSHSSSAPSTYSIIIKAAESGALEAAEAYLNGIQYGSTKLQPVYTALGPLTETDINNAHVAKASIAVFGMDVSNGILASARRKEIQVIQSNVIYELYEKVKDSFRETLPPITVTRIDAEALVLALFPHNDKRSTSVVLGCRVTNGKFCDAHAIRVMRNGRNIWTGTIESMRHLRDEVHSVAKGKEFGILPHIPKEFADDLPAFQPGDIVQSFYNEQVAPAF